MTPASKAHEFMEMLRQKLQTLGSDIVPHLCNEDSGACVIELFGKRSRLGFAFEVDDSESGWFLVTPHADPPVITSGHFHTMDVDALLKRFLSVQDQDRLRNYK